MAAQKNPLGPVGEQVQANVKRIREAQNLTLAELSRRLRAVGREIPTLGLSRIEAGQRRVDADDLVALALALGVSPGALLLPAREPDTSEWPGRPPGGPEVALAAEVTAPWDRAWRWVHGETPLPGTPSDQTWEARSRWLEENRPYMRPLTLMEVQHFIEIRERGPFRVQLTHDGTRWVDEPGANRWEVTNPRSAPSAPDRGDD
ncbi:helix-turn-helix domain-containing protein [Allonocardiopsis opalescens]|uniref:helix-turn-helix domain-containing protein n=1 Tax=Allonocardiopsis opalescens TaxID=1144618 RepID=UPI000D04FCB5|nr:helix-turn-helix transcriptional regulator [Allonocardiopsis opalescens]